MRWWEWTASAAGVLLLGLSVVSYPRKMPEPASRPGGVDVGRESRRLADLDSLPTLREPDVDLDTVDPAADYLGRYVRATRRFGERNGDSCAKVGAWSARGEARVVEAHGDARCGTGGLRDAFVIDLPHDRLALLDGKSGGSLGPWPDGSHPGEGPRPVASIDRIKDWDSKVASLMATMNLSPYRVELLGRGTYRVITLAGWREPIARHAPAEELRPTMKKICAANEGESFGIFAGTERHEILRVRCPSGDTRVEGLRATP